MSCVSPSACTAIGEQHSAAGIVHTLAERWDGVTWSIQPTPNPPGVQFASLAGVSCTSPSACLATGGSDLGTLAEEWDGATWSIQRTPNPPGGGNILLASVACASPSACTAFGIDETGTGQNVTESLLPAVYRAADLRGARARLGWLESRRLLPFLRSR